MVNIYRVNGKAVDIDDGAQVRALSKDEFTELLRQTQAAPNDPAHPAPPTKRVQPPEGTAFAFFTPPRRKERE